MSSDHTKAPDPNPAAPGAESSGRASDDVAAAHQAAGPDGEPLFAVEDEADDLLTPEPEPEEETLEPPPPRVAELAAACVRFVATRYGVMLDFKPETLSLVDQYIRDARQELQVNPSALEIVQSAAGAYLGEVMRQAFGGSWFAEGDEGGWRVDFSRVYLSFNPIGMAREALLLEAQEGWHAHLEMDPGDRDEIENRLAALPEVDEEEYYAPTTRFDVVNTVYDALRAKMQASGLADVRFGPEDYRK